MSGDVTINEKEGYRATQYCTYADEGDTFVVDGFEEQNGKTVVQLLGSSSGSMGLLKVPKTAFEKPNPEFAWTPD